MRSYWRGGHQPAVRGADRPVARGPDRARLPRPVPSDALEDRLHPGSGCGGLGHRQTAGQCDDPVRPPALCGHGPAPPLPSIWRSPAWACWPMTRNDRGAGTGHHGSGAGTAGIFEVSCPFGGGGGHPGADHDVAGDAGVSDMSRAKRERKLLALLLACALLAWGTAALAAGQGCRTETGYAAVQLAAADLLEDCFRQVRTYKEGAGHPPQRAGLPSDRHDRGKATPGSPPPWGPSRRSGPPPGRKWVRCVSACSTRRASDRGTPWGPAFPAPSLPWIWR